MGIDIDSQPMIGSAIRGEVGGMRYEVSAL